MKRKDRDDARTGYRVATKMMIAGSVALTIVPACSSSGDGGEGRSAVQEFDPPLQSASQSVDLDVLIDQSKVVGTRDRYLVAEEVAITLATVTYTATVSVDELASADDLPGSVLADVTVREVDWVADGHWDMGKRVDAETPATGEKLKLVVDDDWELTLGDTAWIAVTSRTRPRPDTDGYIRLVVDAQSGDVEMAAGSEQSLGARISQFARATAPQIGRTASVRDAVRAGLRDAHDWIDRVNIIGPGEVPMGVLATAALSEGPAEVDVWLKQDAGWRQLPAQSSELPGAAEALGRPLVETDITILGASTATYVGLRFPEVGIVGPYQVNPNSDFSILYGLVPLDGSMEILFWSTEVPEPGGGVVVARTRIPRSWDPNTHRIVIEVNGTSVATGLMKPADVETLLLERLNAAAHD